MSQNKSSCLLSWAPFCWTRGAYVKVSHRFKYFNFCWSRDVFKFTCLQENIFIKGKTTTYRKLNRCCFGNVWSRRKSVRPCWVIGVYFTKFWLLFSKLVFHVTYTSVQLPIICSWSMYVHLVSSLGCFPPKLGIFECWWTAVEQLKEA